MSATNINPDRTQPQLVPVENSTPAKPPGWSELALAQMKLQRHREGGFGLKKGPFWVPESRLRYVWQLFWRNAPNLVLGVIYNAEALAGLADWDDRRKGERIVIGMAIKHLAVNGVLPITLLNPSQRCNFKYRLNGDLEQAPTLH